MAGVAQADPDAGNWLGQLRNRQRRTFSRLGPVFFHPMPAGRRAICEAWAVDKSVFVVTGGWTTTR